MAPTPKPPEPKDLLVRADRAAAQEESFRHPLNPASEIHGTTLSRLTGLVKCGVNVIRIPPGKESFVHHVHLVDEEWMYVIAGAGELRIADERFPVLIPKSAFMRHLCDQETTIASPRLREERATVWFAKLVGQLISPR